MNYGFTEEGEQADSANNDIPVHVTTAKTTEATNSQVWIGDSVIKWIHKFLLTFLNLPHWWGWGRDTQVQL